MKNKEDFKIGEEKLEQIQHHNSKRQKNSPSPRNGGQTKHRNLQPRVNEIVQSARRLSTYSKSTRRARSFPADQRARANRRDDSLHKNVKMPSLILDARYYYSTEKKL